MKASLKLNTKITTKQGHPVIVKLHVSAKLRKKETIGHALAENWNPINNEPYKTHPEYYQIYPKVLEYKSKITKINYGAYNFKEASSILFSESQSVDLVFFTAASNLCDDTKTGKLNQTILNSFQLHFPNILIDDITRFNTEKYMKILNTKNKPNGVHTYLRKLTTLFTRLTDKPNPFKGVRPRKVKTAQKTLSDHDILKIRDTRTFLNKYDKKNTTDTINNYRYYWLLMFYLGGIDLVSLKNLRYDKNVVGNRIQFRRDKIGSVFVNNIIPEEAATILKKFDCYPYLVPIYKSTNYDEFRNNMNTRFNYRTKDLQLTQIPLSKSARYTFINRARQLMIDERITIEIVGHEQQKTHSIYTDEYPLSVRDKAHLGIIDVKLVTVFPQQ